MNLRWRQITAAFLSGCLAGGLIGARLQRSAFHKFWQQGPQTGRLLKKFTRDLGLDANQQESVKTLLEKHREKVLALHKETSAKFDQVRLEMRGEIRKLLSPEQQKKLDAIAARWDERRKSR